MTGSWVNDVGGTGVTTGLTATLALDESEVGESGEGHSSSVLADVETGGKISHARLHNESLRSGPSRQSQFLEGQPRQRPDCPARGTR